MAEPFDEPLNLSEFDGHSQINKFVHKDSDTNSYNSTWEFVTYSYERAFQELARKVFEEGRHRVSNLLRIPMISPGCTDLISPRIPR
jgi:hypothetical protein